VQVTAEVIRLVRHASSAGCGSRKAIQDGVWEPSGFEPRHELERLCEGSRYGEGSKGVEGSPITAVWQHVRILSTYAR